MYTEHRTFVEAVRNGRARPRTFTAAHGLLIGAIAALLYFAHNAFVPIALAVLFALVLSGPVEALGRARVPRGIGAGLVIIVLLGLTIGMMNILWTPAQQWFAEAPRQVRVIRHKMQPVAHFVDRVEELSSSAGNIGRQPHAPAAMAAVAPSQGTPILLLDATRAAAAGIVTTIIVTLFLLAGGPPMLARLTSAFVSDLNAAHAIVIIEKVRREVGRFYLTTALINLVLGAATAAIMSAWGMPSPLLWGAAAALLNFIPYAGSATTLILLTGVAIVSFDGLGRVVGVAASFLLLVGVEGQIVQPLLVGRRLELNPLLVFLALWFGGLYWGVAGIVLATPALVALKVIAQNSRNGRQLMEFLGPNDRWPVQPLCAPRLHHAAGAQQ